MGVIEFLNTMRAITELGSMTVAEQFQQMHGHIIIYCKLISWNGWQGMGPTWPNPLVSTIIIYMYYIQSQFPCGHVQ